jgi:copper ion binding protein
MTTMTYRVPGMTCGHCQQAIESEVGALDGVASVSVDLVTKQVTVEGTAADGAVRAAIVEAGYEADPAS